MALYPYNPTPPESAVLAQIAAHESGGDYSAKNPHSTASGAYQFIDSTWQYVANHTGKGTEYATAAEAPAAVQDANALWLLRNYGPNSTTSWGGPEGPPGGYPDPYVFSGSSTQALVDVSGPDASVSTADILSSIENLDVSSPVAGALLLAAGVAAVWMVAQR
jgi:hypothetical protein